MNTSEADDFGKAILAAVLVAAEAETPEEQARVAWRFSDTLRRDVGVLPFALLRAVNNAVQDMQQAENWPWTKNLWSREEIRRRRYARRRMRAQASLEANAVDALPD
jgi:hypothetical protein